MHAPRLFALMCSLAICSASGLFAGPKPVETNQVFREDFTSLGQWTSVDGTKARLLKPAEALIGNGVQQAALSRPVTAFRIEFRIRHQEWRRGALLWVTDETGGQGYGIIWDSAAEDTFDGHGHVSLVRLNQASPPTFQTVGQRLDEVVQSGHPVMNAGFAEFVFERDVGGHMKVSVDGQPLIVARDTTWRKFDTLFLRGNGLALFGPISVLDASPR